MITNYQQLTKNSTLASGLSLQPLRLKIYGIWPAKPDTGNFRLLTKTAYAGSS